MSSKKAAAKRLKEAEENAKKKEITESKKNASNYLCNPNHDPNYKRETV